LGMLERAAFNRFESATRCFGIFMARHEAS
jgi:hypothetical protein